MKKALMRVWLPLLLVAVLLSSASCEILLKPVMPLIPEDTTASPAEETAIGLSEIPSYSGNAYVAVNGNVPYFTDDEKAAATASYEKYAPLDALGRCGAAIASVGKDLMPTEERGSIGVVKPSGWQTIQYENVDGKYLYNRCHLIGYQLTGENANKQNLITGTRYLNIEGMLPFENQVTAYVKETGNHVLYRVTPIFNGNELVALGVLMEGWSVEDAGEEVQYCVFCYNVQPGIVINYADGTSRLAEEGEELLTMGGGAITTAAPETDETPTTENRTDPSSSPSITVVSFTETVKAGTQARVEIKGTAGVEYAIKVTLPSGTVSNAAALAPQTADGNGMVVWEWNIAKNTKTGTARVEITHETETVGLDMVITEADAS